MKINKLKNGICLCATKGCKHVASVNVEVIDKSGKQKKRFQLCEDCSFEFLQQVEHEVIIKK